MFGNSVTLTNTGGNVVTVAVTDYSQPGRVVRKNVTNNQLIISGITTKENPGYVTDRRAIRISLPGTPVEGNPAPAPTVYVQLVVSTPRGEDQSVNARKAWAQLVNFIRNGDNSSPTLVEAFDNGTLVANFNRILAGEQ